MPHRYRCPCPRCRGNGVGRPLRAPESNPMQTAQALLYLTNNHRHRMKLSPLRLSNLLCHVARRHCEDQAYMGRMSHEGSDGSHHSDRMRDMGYHRMYSGENVAEGHYSAEEVFDGWLRSPSHRRNLVHPKFREMGAWVVNGHRRKRWLYWTQVLGVRK